MKRSMKWVAATAVASLLVAACGGDDDTAEDDRSDTSQETDATEEPDEPVATSDATDAPATTAAAPAVEAEPARGISEDKVVSVGSFIAQSGPLAIAGSMADGARLYFDRTNDAGGVNGYTFDFDVRDDGADPTQTVTAAKSLWEEEEVFAFLLPYGSGGNSAVQQYFVDNEVPVLFPFADSRIYFGDDPAPPNVFTFFAPYGPKVELLVEEAYARGARTFVLLHTNDDFGEAGVDGMEAAAERLDVEMVDNVGYDATETNFAPLGRRIAEADADAVIVWGVSGASQIMTVTQESGYTGLWMLNDVFRSGFFLSTLDAIPGLDSSNTFVVWEQLLPQDTDVAGIAEFSAAFTEAYPESDLTLGLLGWSAASLFVDGVRAATEGGEALTWPGLRTALETFEAHDSGSAVDVTFTTDNHLGVRNARLLAYAGNSTLEVATDFVPLPGL